MYMALSMWPAQTQTMSPSLMPILMLTFSACKAAIGLVILVASAQTHGSGHLHNLNLLQC